MHVKIATPKKTYNEYFSTGTVRVTPNRTLADGRRQVTVHVFEKLESRTSADITLKVEDAKRLGHALLLACSDNVEPVQFSIVKGT